MRCNAQCAMCYQSAGPKGSELYGQAKINTDIAKTAIGDALAIDSLIPRFHLSGGEAFIDFEQCLDLISFASEAGYLEVTAVSNGFWAINLPTAMRRAGELRSAGLNMLELSWDIWHMPYIKPERIDECIAACYHVGIDVNLRVLTSKSHSLSDALSALSKDALKSVGRITSGTVLRTGSAARTIPAKEVFAGIGRNGNCHTFLNLTITPNGNVFPCCAGLDQSSHFYMGNICSESIVDIYRRLNKDPLMRQIVFMGVGSLLPILQEHDIPIPDDDGLCTTCWRLFDDKKIATFLFSYFQERKSDTFDTLVREIKLNVAHS